MSGASSVRIAREYYALVLENSIRYDFEYEADALDYYKTEEAGYLTKLNLLTPHLDRSVAHLLQHSKGCVLPYQEEPFYFADVTTPYYSDLLEYGNTSLGQHYGIEASRQQGVVIRGLVASGAGAAGKYLDLELIVTAKLMADDLVTLIDALVSSIAELWIDESYHVLVKPADTTQQHNAAGATDLELHVDCGNRPHVTGDSDETTDAEDASSEGNPFGPSPYD